MRRRIICFSGIDGSGKSTHISLIKEKSRLTEKYKDIWFRYPKFFSFIILGLCRILGLTKVVKHPNGEKTWKTHFYTNIAIRKLWPFFQFVDTILFWMNKVISSSVLGYVIISDRSPVDTLVDVAYDVRNAKLLSGAIGKMFMLLVPSYSFTIILDAEEKIATSRNHDIYDIEQLKIKRGYYALLGKTQGWRTIDTTEPLSKTQAEIMKSVGTYLTG